MHKFFTCFFTSLIFTVALLSSKETHVVVEAELVEYEEYSDYFCEFCNDEYWARWTYFITDTKGKRFQIDIFEEFGNSSSTKGKNRPIFLAGDTYILQDHPKPALSIIRNGQNAYTFRNQGMFNRVMVNRREKIAHSYLKDYTIDPKIHKSRYDEKNKWIYNVQQRRIFVVNDDEVVLVDEWSGSAASKSKAEKKVSKIVAQAKQTVKRINPFSIDLDYIRYNDGSHWTPKVKVFSPKGAQLFYECAAIDRF